MSIIYNTFDFSMSKNELNVYSLMRFIPKDQKSKIFTNIKLHCNDDSKDFVININNNQITNPDVFDRINKYLEENNSRSYFFEGLVSNGNGNYSLRWGS